MAKQIVMDAEARAHLVEGIDVVANAVRTTLGPKGRNVALGKKYGGPTVTHDGVTVAKEIELEEPFANMGAQLIKEAASKTNDVAGDGTTTATVLAQAIMEQGFKNVTAGADPMAIKRGIDKGVAAIRDKIREMATPVEGREQIAQVASLSAHETEIGQLIAEVMEKVGKDGVITVEESRGLQYETEYVDGMNFDRGFISPYFITNTERMEATIEDPYILVTDRKISAVSDILPALEKLLQITKNVVIIGEDMDGEALATLVVNKMRGTLSPLAVKAPGFGDRRKSMLEDMAILTGGNLISEETGRKFDSVTAEDFGRARRVVANKDETTLVGGMGSEEAIQGRINSLKGQIEESSSDYDREKLQERMAKLAGGVAIIKVGAATEIELKEKKGRVEDALSATRAAVEEGIVPGGGVALIRGVEALKDVATVGDEATGIRILEKAMEEPIRLIAENSGHEGSVVLNAVRQGEGDWGFDADVEEYCHLMERGIIDPAKVTRAAVENGASVATMLLTTESLVTDFPEKQAPPAMPPMDY